MDVKVLIQKLTEFIQKNRYVALVLLIGLVLMCLPGKQSQTTQEKKTETIPVQQEVSIEERLSKILSQVAGAGEVQVLLTVASGEQTIYQTNDTLSNNGESTNSQSNAVTVTDSARNEQGLIKQINPPIYQGAIIICKGADSPTVRFSVVEAVSKVTGLSTDRISVLKMK